MLKSILMSLLLISSLYATEYKVIYNVTTAKADTVKGSLLKGIPALEKHYKSQGDTLKATIIISSGAYKFFSEGSEFKNAVERLSNEGVVFEVCSMGMKKRGIKKEDLLPFVTPVFNRTSSLIEWQGKGYSLVNVE